MKYKKIVCVVIDSFGIGQATDAKEFDDVGADTFGHILEYRPDLKIDNLYQLGLGNLHPNGKNLQSKESITTQTIFLYFISELHFLRQE